MLHGLKDAKRRVVPRWRRSSLATSQPQEFSADPRWAGGLGQGRDLYALKRSAWLERPSLETAAEFLQSAFVSGRDVDAYGPAEYILARRHAVTRSVVRLAQAVRQPEPVGVIGPDPGGPISVGQRFQDAIRGEIAGLKRRLREEPRNPVAWTDLALCYANLGVEDKASGAMDRAVALAPNNRFVLRSAARLSLHLEDPERAVDLLRRAESTPNDPWLLSAELASASIADLPPRFVRHGRRLVEEYAAYPAYITELAGSLGTHLFLKGDFKEARRLLRISLLEPNENVVAQAGWTARQMPGFVKVNERLYMRPRSFEARAAKAYAEAQWPDVIRYAELWLSDEPFAARPSIMGSSVASTVLGNFDLARRFAEAAYQANPGNPAIANNYAFGLAKCGDLERAAALLEGLPRSFENKRVDWTITATRGLVALRQGRGEEGRALYSAAVRKAREARDRQAEVLIRLYWYDEEIHLTSRGQAPAGTSVAPFDAEDIALINKERELRAMYERVSASVTNLKTSNSLNRLFEQARDAKP